MGNQNKKMKLESLLRLARNKAKKHYRLIFIEQNEQKIIEEKEIDSDKDIEIKVIFEDYSVGSADKKYPHQILSCREQ